jgi:hypothetical protein
MNSKATICRVLVVSGVLGLSALSVFPWSVPGKHGARADHHSSKSPSRIDKPADLPESFSYRPRQPVSKVGRLTEAISYRPRQPLDTSGSGITYLSLKPWKDATSLEDIREAFVQLGHRNIRELDELSAHRSLTDEGKLHHVLLPKALMLMFEGEAKNAYQVLQEARKLLESSPVLAARWLYTIIYFQGVASLRRGEDENCLHCRGAGACIFPISSTAVHTNPAGSRQAILHFTEYLQRFPRDPGVRWLLNLAYMTLGEHPHGVPPEYLLTFDHFGSEFDIGRFQDISHLVGLSNRMNQAGGAIMDDFDNDGLLDLVVTSWDPTQPMAFYRNKGDGTFEDRTEAAGLSKQYGGLNCVQTDYNNDGYLDIFIPRGAWLQYPMRPSLLRNNGDGTFTDVTREAGLMDPLNSVCGTWADFDNDGFLDLFVCNETGPNRLYRNRGNGTFEEVAARAGVQGKQKHGKGAAWLDYDNDGYPDLFVNYLGSTPQLFHNNRDGTFTDVTAAMGITGPRMGFSCWAFDYDNDGWLDIFATCYQRDLDILVLDITGRPTTRGMDVTRLYRNLGGKRFQDVSKETGVDRVFSTMGSNFADFDNDGYLDFYLGTGEPPLSTLIPKRMFKNVAGKRFAEITATAGTGHLQKGHGVACGDWDRDGNVDLFVELGGAIPGDRYHNVLFQNPGQGNNWLTLKLVGKKTNRAAIGARIKVVTAGDTPLTVHRHISSGSSFGGNPLQQTIGLGKANSVATLEVFWPTSQTTQVFHEVAVNQAIEVTEFAQDYRKLNWTRLPVPKD